MRCGISREAQLFVGWVSGSVTHAGVGFNASNQPTFFSSLSGMGEQREIVAGWGWSGRERSALLRWRRSGCLRGNLVKIRERKFALIVRVNSPNSFNGI
ncbi:MAG: hypothetical protein EWV58_08110 [Microcystis aeruginosa Ma_MB_F_20061100_S19]|nr:MAG: hypothetical protein EWV58_08110 [Microcystis aeruginosa Ma_MB_F_20061100_S19]TRU16191.1 MAG: hypothetical protein EWV59_02400 [Microcystis aeruginosa Ma_MB_F_20061100_S19D]